MALQNTVIFIITVVSTVISLSSLVEGGLKSNMLGKFTDETQVNGTKWAVLIAGSSTFANYRHQSDICHAYHILKRGGLKDENIIVFMYDDIAYNEENPQRGVIINNPKGVNVYPGVPKDYTGEEVNANNIYAVILGNKKAIKGGSGKMLNTNPTDHIFIYYSDHGGPGILGLPNGDVMYANDLIDVLKKKHAAKSYKKMVIYLEACEAGSIFDGLLPNNLSIYATTASDPKESSYACYCDRKDNLPKAYDNICLGDLYSVAWMEDSEQGDPMNENFQQQYIVVKNRTGSAPEGSSHVMQYGDLSIASDTLALYIGANSTNKNNIIALDTIRRYSTIEQRDADLFYLQRKVERAEIGSIERTNAQKLLDEEISHRKHVDQSVASIGTVLFGVLKSSVLQNTVRPAGQPLVDDWDCFKSMVETYEEHCGPLRNYGRKYLRTFANLCNAGIHRDQMTNVAARVCTV